MVVVNPNLPVKTLKELIELAKSKPGTLNYGHAGIGSQTHLAAENFLYATGLNIQNIPYKGEGPAITDLVAGQIYMATPNLPAAIGFINGGKLRALAVTGKERSPRFPMYPPWRRPFRDSKTSVGSDSWRRPARRNRSSNKINQDVSKVLIPPTFGPASSCRACHRRR